jgi:hypothetical protein
VDGGGICLRVVKERPVRLQPTLLLQMLRGRSAGQFDVHG